MAPDNTHTQIDHAGLGKFGKLKSEVAAIEMAIFVVQEMSAMGDFS